MRLMRPRHAIDRAGWLMLLLLSMAVGARVIAGQANVGNASECNSDFRWMQRALDTWASVSRSALERPPEALPRIVFFDHVCAWHLAAQDTVSGPARDVTSTARLRFGEAFVSVQQIAHGDSIRLPSGQVIAAAPTAFASLYQGNSGSFFVMALPALWRQRSSAEEADPALDEFFLGVVAHEMVHTLQLAAVIRQIQSIATQIDSLGQKWPLPANVNDDIVQQHFDTVPGFVNYIEQESAIFFAAGAADDSTRRHLARQGLASADERRDRYYTGERRVFAALEDLFLGMEGAGSWAAYHAALAHASPGTDHDDILLRLRQGYWSQDMGLAVFLILDQLLPSWKSRVFLAEPASVYDLLREAVES
jgi:hypothetical protein